LQEASPEAEQTRLRGELDAVSTAISRLREVRLPHMCLQFRIEYPAPGCTSMWSDGSCHSCNIVMLIVIVTDQRRGDR